MELCKKVQVEYVIHVVESTNLYTHLQFSLLASTWFPRPLGVCLWSLLHLFLVLYEALMLLVSLPIVFLFAVLVDANTVLCLAFLLICFFLCVGIVIPLVWLWLVITCQCCTMPGRAPGQGLARYLVTVGGTCPPRPQGPQPAPVVEGRAGAAAELCAFLKAQVSMTPTFVNHVILVSFPYRRGQLADLCREIVPWYDTIVV